MTTDRPAPQRTDLLTATLVRPTTVERAQLTRIDLAPGQAPGAHHHPCDVVGTVLGGSIRFQLAGHEETVLDAGDPFFEPRDVHVVHFDNASDTEPAAFLACYLLAPGQTEMITMAPPSGEDDDRTDGRAGQ